jgi:DNA helicase MCM8
VGIIKAFFLSLRKESSTLGVTVTTRQLESLKRLSEARAKAELREEVTEGDALEVVKLYQETVFDTQAKEFSVGKQPKRFKGEKPIGEMSVTKQQQAFEEKIREMSQEKGSNLFEFQELVGMSKEMGLKVGDFNQFIERLNVQSVLIKKGGGTYQYISW